MDELEERCRNLMKENWDERQTLHSNAYIAAEEGSQGLTLDQLLKIASENSKELEEEEVPLEMECVLLYSFLWNLIVIALTKRICCLGF